MDQLLDFFDQYVAGDGILFALGFFVLFLLSHVYPLGLILNELSPGDKIRFVGKA
jgi:hypothetical protein